ncbi:MAG: dihydrolipoamide acetyltransferase family protein [Candidatus Binatia bacterium]
MPTEVIMPALGMAQEKGTLVNWLKAEGESVTQGEPLMEVETDKATVEIEAPASGTLAHVSARAGDEVPVGQTLGVILAADENYETRAPANISPRRQSTTREPTPVAVERSRSALGPARIVASPAAKRIAREKNSDLARIKGSGPEGSILAEDVLRASVGEGAEIVPGQRIVPLSAMRRIVGERMAKSKQTAPHFYTSVDADMTEAERQRAKRKEHGATIVPSINDLILWACAQALKEFPPLNSAFTEQRIEFYSDINLGAAVALEDGLVVPVIRNADRLSLDQIAQQSRELADKAQKKKLVPADYEGGTFTVSNLGMFGVDSFIAIINPPQCGILAVGQVARRVVPYGDGIAIRSMMTMILSADHRVADGVIAARFLQKVKGLLEKLDIA